MKITAILLPLLLALSQPANSEQLVIPLDNQDRGCEKCPGRGMSMEMVKKRFGEPRTIHPPVGEPPITRWVYEDFSVYFENSHVIHAIDKR